MSTIPMRPLCLFPAVASRSSLAAELVRTHPELASVNEGDFKQAIARCSSCFRTALWQLLQPAFAVGDERMVGMDRCRFDDDIIPKSNHLKADVTNTPKQLRAARVFSNFHGELVVSSREFFQTRVRPEDGFAFNAVVRMASHREVSRLIATALLFRSGDGQYASGQPCAVDQ